MTRRPNDFLQERFYLDFDHVSVTADTTIKLYKVPAGKSLRIDRVTYINPTGLAQDASNTFNVKITDGTVVIASWDTTTTTGQGSLPANDWVDLVLIADTGTNRVLAETEILTLFLDETGTATLPAGRIVVEGRLL